MTRTRPLLLGVALAMAWVSLGIHLDMLNDHLSEMFYIGVLFAVGSGLLALVIMGLLVPATRWWAWVGGAALNAGMVVAFIVSRTVGLPGGYLEGWTSDYSLGLVSIGVEVVFVLCAVAAVAKAPAPFAVRHATAIARPVGGSVAR